MNYDDLRDDETRVRDDKTGGEKGTKLAQVGALDPVSLIEVARVAGYGANKYAAFNYLKGYDWSLSFNAMQRHAMMFWAGENVDPESQRLHIAMAAWHALALTSFVMRALGTDDRPPGLDPSYPSWSDARPCPIDWSCVLPKGHRGAHMADAI
jgi:hypothetical protein